MSIICEDGKTRINGSTLDIIQDFTNVTAAFRATLRDHFSDQATDEIIALCGQLAYAESDNDKEKIAEIVTKIGNVLIE